MLISVCLMSTFIFFFHVYPFSFVGLGTWDLCSPPFNKYSFFKDLVLTGVSLLFFMNRRARIEGLSNQARQTESLRHRVLLCSSWPSS